MYLDRRCLICDKVFLPDEELMMLAPVVIKNHIRAKENEYRPRAITNYDEARVFHRECFLGIKQFEMADLLNVNHTRTHEKYEQRGSQDELEARNKMIDKAVTNNG